MSAQEGQRRNIPVGMGLQKEGFIINILLMCALIYMQENQLFG